MTVSASGTSVGIMSDTAVRRVPVLALIALALVLLGTFGAACAFVFGIQAALGGEPVVHLFEALFAVSIAAVVAAAVLAIIGLVRRRARALSVVVLVLVLLPFAGMVALRIAATA